MIHSLLCYSLVCWATFGTDVPVVQLKKGKIFEPPKTVTLIKPECMGTDPLGNVYLLDVSENFIAVWDKTGAFQRHFGRKGNGPGEFDFGGWGLVTASDRFVWVYAEGKLHTWDTKGTFLKTETLSDKGFGRWAHLREVNGQLMVVDHPTTSGTTRVLLVNPDLSIAQTLLSWPGAVYVPNDQKGWDYNPGCDKLMAEPLDGAFFIGNCNDSWLKKCDAQGKVLENFSFPAVRTDRDPGEIKIYRDLFNKQARPNDRFLMNPKARVFEVMLPLANNQLLLAELKLEAGLCKGYVIDRKTGAFKATFRQNFEQDQSFLHAYHEKILWAAPDSEGVYEVALAEVVPVPAK